MHFRALTDPAFRAQLEAAPAATLRAAGVDVPDGVAVEVLSWDPQRRYLLLPPAMPADFVRDPVLGRFVLRGAKKGG